MKMMNCAWAEPNKAMKKPQGTEPLEVDGFILENPQQALFYCLRYCPDHKEGCAIECKIRKHFKIPPHGEKYPITPEKPKRRREK